MTIEQLILDATLKASLIVCAAMAGAAAMRRRSAALRHWIVAAGLACVVLTPALRVLVPAWDVRRPEPPTAVLARLSDAAVAAPRAAVPRPLTPVVTTQEAIAAIWFLGCAVSLGMLALSLARLGRLASRSTQVDDERWLRIAGDVARRYRIGRRLTWLQNDDRSLLFTWGFFAPKVVLPAGAHEWSDERIRIVVGHELAHVRRNDWVFHVAAALVQALYWFNPLVWIACARLRRESEYACDDAVLNLGVERTVYAEELVRLARTFAAYRRSPAIWAAAPAMARPSSLERRVRAMLTGHGSRAPITRTAAALTFVALLALTLPLAGFGAQTGPASYSAKLLDTIGRFMPGVRITFTHLESGVKFETRSDSNGQFSFAAVQPGAYELFADAPGFQPRYRVTLKPGTHTTESVYLQIGMLEETLTIVKPAAPEPARPRRMTSDSPPLVPRSPGRCDDTPSGGCIDPPKKLDNTRPRYPDDRSETVTVELRGRIGTDGRMKTIEGRNTTDATRAFVDAAIEAVAQWRFTPTYLDGVPVEVEIDVHAHFVVE
jgi:beta-lactamase regulating signal transducer with metallopeptidase domain